MNWLGKVIEEDEKKYHNLLEENPHLYDEQLWDIIHVYTCSGDTTTYEGNFKEDIKAVFDEDNVPFTDEAWDVIWRNTLTQLAVWQWRAKLWKCCCHLLGSEPDTDFHQALDDLISNADPCNSPLPAAWEEDGITIPLFAIGERLLDPPS